MKKLLLGAIFTLLLSSVASADVNTKLEIWDALTGGPVTTHTTWLTGALYITNTSGTSVTLNNAAFNTFQIWGVSPSYPSTKSVQNTLLSWNYGNYVNSVLDNAAPGSSSFNPSIMSGSLVLGPYASSYLQIGFFPVPAPNRFSTGLLVGTFVEDLLIVLNKKTGIHSYKTLTISN